MKWGSTLFIVVVGAALAYWLFILTPSCSDPHTLDSLASLVQRTMEKKLADIGMTDPDEKAAVLKAISFHISEDDVVLTALDPWTGRRTCSATIAVEMPPVYISLRMGLGRLVRRNLSRSEQLPDYLSEAHDREAFTRAFKKILSSNGVDTKEAASRLGETTVIHANSNVDYEVVRGAGLGKYAVGLSAGLISMREIFDVPVTIAAVRQFATNSVAENSDTRMSESHWEYYEPRDELVKKQFILAGEFATKRADYEMFIKCAPDKQVPVIQVFLAVYSAEGEPYEIEWEFPLGKPVKQFEARLDAQSAVTYTLLKKGQNSGELSLYDLAGAARMAQELMGAAFSRNTDKAIQLTANDAKKTLTLLAADRVLVNDIVPGDAVEFDRAGAEDRDAFLANCLQGSILEGSFTKPDTSEADLSVISRGVKTFFDLQSEEGAQGVWAFLQEGYAEFEARPDPTKLELLAAIDLANSFWASGFKDTHPLAYADYPREVRDVGLLMSRLESAITKLEGKGGLPENVVELWTAKVHGEMRDHMRSELHSTE